MNVLSSASFIAEKINGGSLSAVDVVTESLNAIRNSEVLNNFITVCGSEALEQAGRVDSEVKNGKRGLLMGVPIAVKDNICTKGVKTTCASKFLSDHVPEADAEVVSRLKAAGAIIIGKTNMDELAFGSANEFSAFGAVRNARDNNKVAGGSSGGSANAVSAGQVPLALGTDTGGSVRQPAAYCGVVGLKPTYGAVDGGGVMGLCPSMEQVGTFSNDCNDAALLFSVIAGRSAVALDGSIKGKTIGIVKEVLLADIGESAKGAFVAAVQKLKSLGANVMELSVPSFPFGLAAYHALSSAEAVHSFKRFVDNYRVPYNLLGDEVKRRLVSGAAVLDGKNYDDIYIKAAKVRTVIVSDYLSALKKCDALLCPTTAGAATDIGAVTDPQKSHMCDSFLAPVSLAGLPALSVPFGSEFGMPLGVQIIGRKNAEFEILNIGKALMSAS